ncbi:hypothetical protein UFOVP360_10 [uncultured Caudovirales phage]|uniref:Uncharacterized protein n=1 Tax=uncultured Caudovirales phage TaxID=2100421 RepID=A0A6J7WWM7_9CAUD|nr:hypothetical protein UFOVP360_10 [uncultured Caudovirales phage]
MPSTYTLIKGETIASSAASYTFTAIPSTFTDLVLRISARSDDASTVRGVNVTYNGVSGTSYSEIALSGNGSTATSFLSSSVGTSSLGVVSGGNTTANTFGSLEAYIPSYTASQNKQVSSDSASEDNATAAVRRGNASLFRNTSAISSITLVLNAGNFATGSSFYLYGVKNA